MPTTQLTHAKYYCPAYYSQLSLWVQEYCPVISLTEGIVRLGITLTTTILFSLVTLWCLVLNNEEKNHPRVDINNKEQNYTQQLKKDAYPF